MKNWLPNIITFSAIAGAIILLRKSKKSSVPSLLNNTNIDMSTNQNLPRGYRNNNPLNIRYSSINNWRGKVADNTDGAFEQFISMPYGYRAALYLLRKYIKSYGCDTVQKIINKWAPPSENNTASYINHVCSMTGYKPTTEIGYNNAEQLCKLAYAMSIIENGNTDATRAAGLPNMDAIYTGWNLL